MATYDKPYIPDEFEEEMIRNEEEAGKGVILEGDDLRPTLPPTPQVQTVVQEILYEPPVRFAFAGFMLGSLWTALIFIGALLITNAR